MADHHHFSFVWQYTAAPVIEPSAQAQAIRDYLGNEVIFTFKGLNGVKLMAKGVINSLESIDLHGCPAGLHVTGISHTIFLDDMKRSRTFMEQDLETIVKTVLAEGPTDFFNREAIIPTYDPNLDYMPQYNETNFDFLKRLAQRYGQWFYSDGMRMQFGQLKASKTKLINGGSLHHFRIQTLLFSHKESLGGYDYNSAANIKNSSGKTTTGSGDGFATAVGYRQGAVRQPDLEVGAYTAQAPDSSTLAEMVKLQTNGKDANSIFYSGLSYLPLGIGQKFTIENKTVEHNLVVIEVTHNSEVHGNYSCNFKAIPSDVGVPHYTDVHAYAKAESQPAKVIDNNDPEGMGRVKVEFHWAGGNMKSDWMRKLQSYAGEGRGMYWTPEIGDEVVVDFVGGSAERPYVVGSHYNGKNKSGYANEGNDFKVIKTRSGHYLEFEELKNIKLADKKGNIFHIDSSSDTLNITALKTINLTAQNINLIATENVTTTAGMNIVESAGVDKSTTVGMLLSTHVGGDSMFNVIGSHMEHIEGDFKSHTEQERQEVATKDYNIHSSEDNVNVKSSKELQQHSGEKTKS
ncbi:type IV secretion protein Rhs, partial [Flavobacterium psychrophilum]|nr:type IV secretion protein Rhs [Flavobacterium psychrophilum]